jgi:hypothetical protein
MGIDEAHNVKLNRLALLKKHIAEIGTIEALGEFHAISYPKVVDNVGYRKGCEIGLFSWMHMYFALDCWQWL